MEGDKTKDYLNAIPKRLFHLENARIRIGSIVIDGNTAQKKALSPNYKKSLYYELQLHNFKHVLVILQYTACIKKNWQNILQVTHLRQQMEEYGY